MRVRAVSIPDPPRLGLQTNLPSRSRTPSPSSPRLSQMPSFSLLGALEFRQVVASLQHQAASSSLDVFESPITPYAGGHYHSRTMSMSRPRTVSQVDAGEVALGLPLHDRSPLQVNVTFSDEPDEFRDDVEELSRSATSGTPAPTVSDGDSDPRHSHPPTWWQRTTTVFSHAFHTLFPSLHHFKSKTFLGKIVSIFAAPAVMALTLTLPVVVLPYESHHVSRDKLDEGRLIDFEEEGIERALIAEEEVQEDLHELLFNKWLMAAQCVFGPLFCTGVLFSAYHFHFHEVWVLTFLHHYRRIQTLRMVTDRRSDRRVGFCNSGACLC